MRVFPVSVEEPRPQTTISASSCTDALLGAVLRGQRSFDSDHLYIDSIEESAWQKTAGDKQKKDWTRLGRPHCKACPLRYHYALTNGVSPSSLQSTWYSCRLRRKVTDYGGQLHGKGWRRTAGGIKSARHGDSSFARFGFDKHTNCLSTFTNKSRPCYRRKHEAGYLERVALPSAPCSAPVEWQPRYRRLRICVDGDVLLSRRLL